MAGDWLTISEIADLGAASLPSSPSKLAELIERQGWRNDERLCRIRFGRGGGREYHISLLPPDARAKALAQAAPVAVDSRSNALWAAFERLSDAQKEKAQQRLSAVEAVQSFGNSCTREVAVAWVAKEWNVASSTLWNWLAMVDGVAREDRLPALASRHQGRTATAECDPRAWDYLVGDYLRPEAPAFEACAARMLDAAKAHGWGPIPSTKTLKRRLEREFPRAVKTLARAGREAAARSYPAQRRDRSIFHAVQAVNADGHKFDVFVKWTDGSIGRAMMIGFQDLYSGVILSHRIDKSENKEMVRLAFSDLVRDHGVPEMAWLDNGRAFASKWLTGRQANRFRFKIKDEDPQGILTALGVTVHWTTPYHGQSKPIERAWKDMCEEIAKHPAFAGAYTGNNPIAKPENYGAKAVPELEFRRIVAAEIARHNARPGRRTRVANGRSFLQAYEESIANGALVRRATEAQRRMLLLAAEGVTVRAPNAVIELMGSRYWAEELGDFMGKKVVARFDPEALAEPLAIYTLDGRFVCVAEAIGDVAFNDVTAAQEHARRRGDYLRKQKAALEAGRRLDIADVAALLPTASSPEAKPPKITRLVAAGGGSRGGDWGGADDFGRGVALLAEGTVLPFSRSSSEEDE